MLHEALDTDLVLAESDQVQQVDSSRISMSCRPRSSIGAREVVPQARTPAKPGHVRLLERYAPLVPGDWTILMLGSAGVLL